MEVPRLGVKSELQLPAFATAIASQGLSHVCDHSSQQHQFINPLSEARDRTLLLDISWFRYLLATVGTPLTKPILPHKGT